MDLCSREAQSPASVTASDPLTHQDRIPGTTWFLSGAHTKRENLAGRFYGSGEYVAFDLHNLTGDGFLIDQLGALFIACFCDHGRESRFNLIYRPAHRVLNAFSFHIVNWSIGRGADVVMRRVPETVEAQNSLSLVSPTAVTSTSALRRHRCRGDNLLLFAFPSTR